MKVGSLSGGSGGETSDTDNTKPDDSQRQPPEGGNNEEGINVETIRDKEAIEEGTSTNQRKTDLAKALDNHVDKLDAMLDSADNAYHSMSQQNKQMKRFLK